MKKQILTLLTATLVIFASCSKKDSPSPEKAIETTKFEVKSLSQDTKKAILGQRVIISSELNDATGNITYEWTTLFDNSQIGKTLTGRDIKSVKMNPDRQGEYTIRLTITRGDKDIHTKDLKFVVYPANFQYGVWGDSEATITNAESDNGNLLNNTLIGVPNVIENNAGLTMLTYKKNNSYYTYYFKAGKLYAGAFTTSYNYVNKNTDLRGAYTQFYQEKINIEKELGANIPEQKVWNNTPDQVKYWDTDALTRSQAIGLNYLILKWEGTSVKGKGKLDLLKQTSAKVLFQYVLASE